MIRKYLRSDGQHFEVDAGAAADEAMQKDGAFTLISEDSEPQPISAIEPNASAPIDRSKMKKAELVAEAESLEIEVPEKATNKAIIALIEAKLAEGKEAEDSDDETEK